MGFIRRDKTYAKYYDEFVVLLGTGMRVSEFCGLTKRDLDFENRRIRVDHQLVRERGGKYYVEKTKTECGCRYIPMTEEVYQSLNNILAHRKKVKTEIIVDGYSSFLLLDKDDKPTWHGIRTLSAAARALMVSIPSEGIQSMRT